MRYKLKCKTCGAIVWVRGSFEPDTNATVLDDDAIELSEACEHIVAGEYEIVDEEPIEFEHYEGDGVFADNH